MANTTYQWDAADYARHSSAQYQWAQELVEKLELIGDESVLDIGCGDGKVTAGLARSVPRGRVVGIDRSWGMVLLAARRFGSATNLAFAQMDAARLSFAGGFEVAFSNAVLHWVRDQRGMLEGTAHCLKPGGRLLFQMGGQGNAAEVIACINAVIARPDWSPFFSGFSFPYTFPGPEAYRALLRACGLTPHRIELIPKDMQHAGQEGLSGWIRTTWLPYLERVPPDRREALIRAVVETYVQNHPPDGQGMLHVQMVRLEVEAVKVETSDQIG